MKLIKTIYKNNEQVNQFEFEGFEAETELINLMHDKIIKRYRVKIEFYNMARQIIASLYFNHIDCNGNITNYEYYYYFTEVDDKIDLR